MARKSRSFGPSPRMGLASKREVPGPDPKNVWHWQLVVIHGSHIGGTDRGERVSKHPLPLSHER
jgi:hypothetical protein